MRVNKNLNLSKFVLTFTKKYSYNPILSDFENLFLFVDHTAYTKGDNSCTALKQ